MITRNQTKIKTVLTLAAAMAMLVTSANAAITIDATGSVTVADGMTSSKTLVASFDASGSDKLVVTVSMERDRGDPTTRIVSVTYNGTPMIEAIQFKNYDEGPAAIFYLDNPGPAGPIVANGNAKMNGAHGSWLALSGTAEGVGPSSSDLGTSTSITTVANDSLVVAHNHVNGGTVPTAVAPLSGLLSSNGQYSEAASGYQQVSSAGTVTPTFTAGTTPVTVAAAFEPPVSPGPTDPSPADGATVPVGYVELSWTNMDPNNPADPVYVDVWFGTDPDPKNGTKVVDAEPNITSVTVSAPTEGTYYWQVGNYIHGSATGDPCEGDVWSFNAVDDLPPSFVDAGIDMVTWSGQPVSLDATVVDDGKSALTYLWSANPGAGVVFNPNEAVEDPTVTITKATANPSTVTLTLAVHDDSYDPTPVEDTMEIDVYDDACQAAIGKGLDPIGPADFDANCVTDLRDYAVLAAKWLVEYALTAPVPKP